MKKYTKDKSGSAILWALLSMSLLLTIAAGTSVIFISELRQTSQVSDSSSAYMAAETGYERARNYAMSGVETMVGVSPGIIVNKSVSGTAGSPTYDFQARRAGVGNTYDYDNKTCSGGTPTKVFCFFAQGKSGITLRKLAGFIVQTSATVSDFPTGNAGTDYPSGAVKDKVFGMTYSPPIATTPTVISFEGVVDLKDMEEPGANTFVGLQDIVRPTNRGIGININYGGGTCSSGVPFNFYISHIYSTGAGTVDAISPESSALQFCSKNTSKKVKFRLTYRRKVASTANHSVTLQLNSVNETEPTDDGKCLGLITIKYALPDFVPAYNIIAPYGKSYNTGMVCGATLNQSCAPVVTGTDLKILDLYTANNGVPFITVSRMAVWVYQ